MLLYAKPGELRIGAIRTQKSITILVKVIAFRFESSLAGSRSEVAQTLAEGADLSTAP